MKPMPFRLKIALLSTLISGLVLGCLGVGAGYWLYRQKVEAVDTEIRSIGIRHPGWLANRSNFDRFTRSLEFVFGEGSQGRVILLVRDAQGQTLYVSPSWPDGLEPEQIDRALDPDPKSQLSAIPNGEPGGSSSRQGGGFGRGGLGRGPGPGRGGNAVVFTQTPRFLTAQAAGSAWRLGVMGNDELRLVVGLNYDPTRAELSRMRNVFLAVLPVALLLVGGGGWLVAGRALSPLSNISQLAERVTAHGLDQRIPASNEDPEIARLIHVLNGMMDRLEAGFRQATRFSADASHELKTPLAIMQGEVENALQAAVPGASEQRVFSNLLEEIQRLKRITRGLLLLSQADAGELKLTREPVDLSADLEAMMEDARALAADSNLQFSLDIPPGLWIRADRGLLDMALLNLVHNAVKYNEPGGPVGVKLAAEKDRLVLTLSNGGPGIPAGDQFRVFERFFRVDSARNRAKDGLGLGLSLAREILHAHGGRLVLKESCPGRTCFEVTFPPVLRGGGPGSAPRPRLPAPADGRPGHARPPSPA